MLTRPKFAGLLAALVASAALLLSGCSSKSPRDINYGTDVGLGYVPPDVAPTATGYDAAVDAGIAVDSANTVDSANAVDGDADGGVVVDGDVDAAINGDS